MPRRQARSEPSILLSLVVLVLAVAVSQDWLGAQSVAAQAALVVGQVLMAFAGFVGELAGAVLQPFFDGLTSTQPLPPTPVPAP